MNAETPSQPVRRSRPRPGERRLQILQSLADMLQHPDGERVTTAALAGRLQVSEAALYRHFASKAQMFEGLIEFIESTVFGLINQIGSEHDDGLRQLQFIVGMLLGFAEKNPGMTRVLVGDALVTEHERLQARINQLTDRIEASLRQCFRLAVAQQRLPADTDAAVRAGIVLAYVQGRWLRYAKSGFRRSPTELAERQIALLLA
jgi:TetR/AcrR family transcriptional regulator